MDSTHREQHPCSWLLPGPWPGTPRYGSWLCQAPPGQASYTNALDGSTAPTCHCCCFAAEDLGHREPRSLLRITRHRTAAAILAGPSGPGLGSTHPATRPRQPKWKPGSLHDSGFTRAVQARKPLSSRSLSVPVLNTAPHSQPRLSGSLGLQPCGRGRTHPGRVSGSFPPAR